MSDHIARAAQVIHAQQCSSACASGPLTSHWEAVQALDTAGLLAKYPHLEVDGDWLIEVVNEHTCGAGPGSGAGHEPGCGTIPVGRLERPGVLAEIADERVRQDQKWGEQNHPDGTGPHNIWPRLFRLPMDRSAGVAKGQVDFDAEMGRSTYAGILLEEVFEAMAESDPQALRVELVQVAAVAAQWVEAIDRRIEREGGESGADAF